ncbi:MAG TPA: YbaK/EbsC family protein [Nitrospiraceae bacterium]|nr:YbaK/EbsC family protein [Nitrospiraceae bacterium]
MVDDASLRQLPGAAQRVQKALLALGVDASVVELPSSTRTAVDAANAVGCSVQQIVKSLVFRSDSGVPILVLASGANRVDVALVSTHVGTALGKADADFVRSTTGFAIGGVPPVGHSQTIMTFIDQDLLPLETLWAAGGTPQTVFALTPQQLVHATRGRVIRISERPQPQ